MKLSNKVKVSTPFGNNKHLPLGFRWLTFHHTHGVLLTLQGDLSDTHNLQQELEEVKQLVNRDLNKVGAKLRDTYIKIEFMEEK